LRPSLVIDRRTMSEIAELHRAINAYLGEPVTVTVRYRCGDPIAIFAGVLGLAVGPDAPTASRLAEDDAQEAGVGFYAVDDGVIVVPTDATGMSGDSLVVVAMPDAPVELVIERRYCRATS
jgi:hypothetical protein